MTDFSEETPIVDDDIADPVELRLRASRSISDQQAVAIRAHANARDLGFGEAAVQMGLISPESLTSAYAAQYDLSTEGGKYDGEPVAFTMPQSRQAEDYRSIRNALALRWFKHPQGAKTLAVISPSRGEGRSLMAANLAVCFAQVGFRTLLVDTDMRNPAQHQLFNIPENALGVADYLASRTNMLPCRPIAGLDTLSVISSGGRPPNPQELLLRLTLNSLVTEAYARFEMVIFDTPAASVGGDFQIIGAAAKGALLVTQEVVTRTRLARKQIEQCRGFGIQVVGSAMLSHHQ